MTSLSALLKKPTLTRKPAILFAVSYRDLPIKPLTREIAGECYDEIFLGLLPYKCLHVLRGLIDSRNFSGPVTKGQERARCGRKPVKWEQIVQETDPLLLNVIRLSIWHAML